MNKNKNDKNNSKLQQEIQTFAYAVHEYLPFICIGTDKSLGIIYNYETLKIHQILTFNQMLNNTNNNKKKNKK